MDLVQVCLCDRSFEVLKMAPSRRYRMSTPGLYGGISWSVTARYKAKSEGARTQPCFNLDVMGNPVSLLSWNTHPDISFGTFSLSRILRMKLIFHVFICIKSWSIG